jgi:hypothetical protein
MISSEQLTQIDKVAREMPLSDAMVSQLRSSFPGIHFTYCMDDDVEEATPVLEGSAFNLYLIDSRNHCLSFTSDLAVASGVVVAEIDSMNDFESEE